MADTAGDITTLPVGVAAPEEVLHRVFGFPAFRGLQADVVARVMAGGDALVLMPTGGGKSVCYQVPALCLDGMGIVVSHPGCPACSIPDG
jgi:ATP-dependent DNA helicase RecQ